MSDELSEIDKQLSRIQITALPGWAFIGIGFFGYFSNQNLYILPLSNDSVCLTMVLIGAYIAIWEFRKVLPLYKRRKQLDP